MVSNYVEKVENEPKFQNTREAFKETYRYMEYNPGKIFGF